MSERDDRKSPSKFANYVRRSRAQHGGVKLPDYETPENAISYQPADYSSRGEKNTTQCQASPVSLPRVAWMERPDPCPEVKGLS